VTYQPGDADRASEPPDDIAEPEPIEIPFQVGLPVDEAAAAAEDGGSSEGPAKRSLPFWVEVPILVLVALVIAVVIKTFLTQAFFIPSGSMETTLNIDDRILVNKLAFRFDDPHRGDVIVFDSGERRDESILESLRRNVGEAIGLSSPESDFIKRVIGLPGEVLEIRDNQVFIDGVAIAEPYVKVGTVMADFGPVVVEADHYFMMGDNRNLSSDSRFIGAISRDRLVGRAFALVWPPSNWSGL